MSSRATVLVCLLVLTFSVAAPPDGAIAAQVTDAEPTGATSTSHNSGGQPGAIEYSDALKKQVVDAIQAKGSDYEPRTRHKSSDGKALYTNRLILENSPYLLQHAHNPVDWHPWGDEAFEIAKKLGRPVLMSVGYTTCHWCHVMEEESFEDAEIAQFINENYIAIKVDRERRPDVDAIYMDAVRMMTRRGGWPMTVLMDPERKPFFGGTYFPARDGDRGAPAGFLTIITELNKIYKDDPERITQATRQITEQLLKQAASLKPESVPSSAAIETHVTQMKSVFDSKDGGFGRAPKFPRPATLDLLFRYHRRTGDDNALHMATHTLDKMADGGIYDQVGSGFHRYSVDAIWLVPHFEKMLYDNAQLVSVYLDAYQITQHAKAARVARDVLDYVLREMTSPTGGFYSATDADSKRPDGHTEEGWFFTWTIVEILGVLSGKEFAAFSAHHRLSNSGNFEGRNILHVTKTRDASAQQLGIDRAEFDRNLASAYHLLYQSRESRPKPILDDKVLVAWNALMISAAAKGYRVLDDKRYLVAAQNAAAFLRDNMWDGAELRRTWRNGQSSHRGVLADYAFYVQALLDLFEASQDISWLTLAIDIQAKLDAQFWDTSGGGYFMASESESGLLVRQKPMYDGAIPSGNSIAARNLVRLYHYTTKDSYRTRAEECFGAFAEPLKQGAGLPALACSLDAYLDPSKEILIVKPTDDADAEPFLAALRGHYLPNHLIVVTTEARAAELAKHIPILGSKVAKDGKVTAYVCQDRVCQLPTTDPAVFAKQIVEVVDYPPGAVEGDAKPADNGG